MRLFHRFALFSATIFFTSGLLADTIERSSENPQRDIEALREWINTRRQVTVKEIGGALSISGEVRTEFQATTETVNGIKQRGHGGATPINSRAYDVEVNIMIDYRADRTWAAIKLEFDNDAGIFSGTFNKIKLEKAYFGARLVKQDTHVIDLEIGRRKMGTILDSKLEFNSFFDGAYLKYDRAYEKVGDFYAHAGIFVINERVNQYGFVGEFGLLDIRNTGVYAKYSIIDWDTKDTEDRVRRQQFDFIISQFILGYKFIPKYFLKKVVILYAAGLYNHEAEPIAISDFKKANKGGYLGVSIGELRKQGDWAFDGNYQVLQAQAVPDFDISGIGLGNANDSGFYTLKVDGKGGPTTRKTAAGNGNYRGFVLTLEYLFTNNLNLQQQWQQSITLDKSIGPFRRFKQYEMELVYLF